MADERIDRYKKGDRVFAKLKGYPPWPAQVEERAAGKEEKYFLHFYGTHDSATVKPQMMFPYTPEHILKYGKPTKPSPTFKKAMDEIEANLELYATAEDAVEAEPVEPEVFEDEGELQIDETPPPVLKREGKLPPPVKSAAPKEVAPKPPRRISKAKRDSLSLSTGGASPVVETPPPVPTVQPEIISRSGRKIKPKRFADDEIGSPVSMLAKAALQSSFDERQEAAAAAAVSKRTSKKQKLSVSEAPPTPVVVPAPVKEPQESVPPPKSRARVKITPRSSRPPKGTPLPTIPAKKQAAPPPVIPPPVSSVESPEPSPIEAESDSNAPPSVSRTDEEEVPEDLLEEDTREGVEDKENSAGSWVNTAPEEDTGSEISSSSKTEKHFTEIPVSPDESSGESIKITLAVKKDTEVEIIYNHDKPKEFESKQARVQWDLATARNALKIRQTLESVEPAAIELFNMLLAAVEEKEGEFQDVMEKALSEKRAEKLRKLRVEGEVIEIIGDVINCLSSRAADCDRAIELLERLSNHTLDTLILKKHPEIVETVRKLRFYEGNAEEWDLTQEEADEFDDKTAVIREKASTIYDTFKAMFGTPALEEKAFEAVYSEELERFQEFCANLPPKDFLDMTEEPTSEPSVTEEAGNADELEEELDPEDGHTDPAEDLGEEEQAGNEENIISSEGDEAEGSTLDDDIRAETDMGDSEDLTIDDDHANTSNLAGSDADG